MEDLLPDSLVQNGTGDLHPSFRIPGHQIRRADKDSGIGTGAEDENTGVFQEAAHNRENPDAVGLAGHSRTEAANAPDIHNDVHPGLAGFGQLVDQLPISNRVAL